jgi:hypothetical protein
MPADFVLLDPWIDDFGHVWATVEGKPGVNGLIATKHYNMKLVSEGLVMNLDGEKGTYLAQRLEPYQDTKFLAKILADIFIKQDISNIKPT